MRWLPIGSPSAFQCSGSEIAGCPVTFAIGVNGRYREQSASLDGIERTRLYRLAWDASISAFAGRQELYEYFFFGDPVRMAGTLVAGYDRASYVERVREFLHRDPSPVDELAPA